MAVPQPPARVLICICTLGILAAPLSAQPPDTTWFGGTYWAPDSMRWEAVQGSVWTFDSGVGSAIVQPGDGTLKQPGLHRLLEGWTGLDFTGPISENFFRRLSVSDFGGEDDICVGSPASLEGDASMWAGILTPEASSLFYGGGRGYGNRWLMMLGKSFVYPGSGDVSLAYDYRNETEPGFDFTLVKVDTSGDGSADAIELTSYTGVVAGRDSLVLSQATGTLPSGAQTITILFVVSTDAIYSDEDGDYPTSCGAFAVDSICLNGVIVDESTFEEDEDGWQSLQPRPGPGGDWADLKHRSDLPGIPEDCSLTDSVLVLFDQTQNMVNSYQNNVAVSPWIDLMEAGVVGFAGRVIELDVYQDFVRPDRIGLNIRVQYYPAVRANGQIGVSDLSFPFFCYYGPDPCLFYQGCTNAETSPVQLSIPARLYGIPPSAEQVRIAVGLYNGCETWGDCPGENTDTTPYFDNIRFGVYDTTRAVVDVPIDGTLPNLPVLGYFTPNPYRGVQSGTIPFTISQPGHAQVQVYDISGRLVKTVFDKVAKPGNNEAQWDGTDQYGRAVPSGIYLYRLVTGNAVHSRKLVMIR